jgi:hypothetical protein
MGDAGMGNTNYVRVNIRTVDGSQFNGKVNLSGNDRVSDVFTKGDTPFIVVTDVVHTDHSGRTLFVNRHHIVWVEPED